jgi:hypothetical protein
MKKTSHKSRSCKETVSSNELNKPLIGKLIFVPKKGWMFSESIED